MARPVRRRIGGDSTRDLTRWSVFFPEPLVGLAAGLAAMAYGGVYLTLLLRDTWNPMPDLLAFVLFAGITIAGAANILRWLPALNRGYVVCIATGYLLVMAGWSSISLAHATPLSDLEGPIYGCIAAAGLAAVLDDVRGWVRESDRCAYKRRWFLLPAAVFALWSIVELGGMPAGPDVLSLVAIAAGLAVVSLGSVLLGR